MAEIFWISMKTWYKFKKQQTANLRIAEENHTKAHHNQAVKNSDKQKILGAAREKRALYIRYIKEKMIADFLSEIMQKRRQWSSIFKALKEKSQPRITYPVQVSFKNRQK